MSQSEAPKNAIVQWNAAAIAADPAEQKKLEIYFRDRYGTNLTDAEWGVFRSLMVITNANPFLGEIYAVKYGDQSSIFLGRNIYRKAAMPHPLYDGHVADAVFSKDFFEFSPSTGEVTHRPNMADRGRVIGAYFLGWRKGVIRPIYAFVHLSEYYKGCLHDPSLPAEGKNIKKKKNHKTGEFYNAKPTLWDSSPATMITKVAESQGLRMMLPEMFSGTYAEEERWDEYENTPQEKPIVTTMINQKQLAQVSDLWAQISTNKGWDQKELTQNQEKTYKKKFQKNLVEELTEEEAEKTIKTLQLFLKKEEKEKKQNSGDKTETPSFEQYTILDGLWKEYFEKTGITGEKKHQEQISIYGKITGKFSLTNLSSEDVGRVIEGLNAKIVNLETKTEPKEEKKQDISSIFPEEEFPTDTIEIPFESI